MPAAPCYNNFEGQATTTTLTVANSGGKSGTPFDARGLGSGTTNQYLAAAGFVGGIGLDLNSGATPNAANVEWDSLGSLNPAFYRFFINFRTLPGSTSCFLRANDNAAARSFLMLLDTTGHVIIQNSTQVTKLTSGTALSATTWYRFEIQSNPNATTGTVQYSVYSGLSNTLIDSGTSTASTMGANNDQVVFGHINTVATSWEVYLDAVYAGKSAQSIPPMPQQLQSNSGLFKDRRLGGRW